MNPPAAYHLTADERHALKEISKGAMQAYLPMAMTDRLSSLGLVEQKLGGFRLTLEGHRQVNTKR